MINFRYHVVSLTSVFLALAVGLVLGTAALNGPVLDTLNNDVTELRASNSKLRNEVLELRGSVKSRDDYVRQISPSVMAGTLADRTVAIVEGPGAAAADREGIVEFLADGGAAVTGIVSLREKFTEPQQDATLHDLASQSVPPGVELPQSGKGAVTSSAVLASVLLKGAEVADVDRATVLEAFGQAGFLTVEQTVSGQADAVIFLLGEPFTDGEADARNGVLVAMMEQFDQRTSYDVASAPSAGAGNEPLAAIRANESLASRLSTVDGVSTAEGQLAVAMALVEQFADRAGAYGTGDGSTARVPAIR